ncbi:MAG TPA: DNA alkylation repair protein [Humidesulfovibrio sp.]|uniref:DNA alkylation repair protein n=1 Tax=Humidesulfovibrio sp. TaxID=2910988 RepID=UPI002B9CA7C2|nr:DNA alkylation repair protein [Humidesulfovibrio sp.]HWR04307.1 DNA alkylation repair protein [Humidesulfovibrio sp.]
MFDTTAFLTDLRAEMVQCADPAHRDGLRWFFKEAISPLGVRSSELNALVARRWRELRTLDPAVLLQMCNTLWQSDVFEDPTLASKWCSRAVSKLGPAAFETFEGWLSTRVNNWAHCDVLCTGCLGPLLMRHPELWERTLPWLASPNRWLRRGAAVSLVPPGRRGLFLDQVFHVADALLTDDDDLVRKGYGWMLKETSKAWPQEVLDFVLARRARMPRVALRYAIELMPADWRRKAMER